MNDMTARESVGDHLLKVGEVLEILSISDGTLRRGIEAGTLPAPIFLTPGCKRWRASDITAAIKGGSEAAA